MTNLPNTVEVTISGRKFSIRTDKDLEYVQALASRLESMIEKIKSGNNRITLEKALLITCFYVLDENESLKEQIKDLGYEIKRLEEGAKILINSRKKILP